MRTLRSLRALLVPVVLIPTLTACPEQPAADPVTGSVEGTVLIDGAPAAGVTVSLDGETTTVTNASGEYRFDDVEEGAHVVEISGFPADVTFPQPAKSVTISDDGDVVQADFSGAFVRTSAITGTVEVGEEGLEGVTVTLGGRESRTTTTDSDGGYAFTGLAAGDYTVSISGLPDGVAFDETSRAADVDVGETEDVSFEGVPLDGAIEGEVVVGAEPQAGVTVTSTHVETGQTRDEATDEEGAFVLDGLRRGMWTVEISGWDDGRVTFPDPDRDVDLTGSQLTVTLTFEGTFLPGSVGGTVTIDGAPSEGVMVRVTDAGGTERTTTTDASGAYLFEGVAAGSATVQLELDPDVACDDHPRDVDVPAGGVATADFDCAVEVQPASFAVEDASFPRGPVAPGQSGTMPLRNEDGEVVGEAVLETGTGGAYFRDLQRFFWDAPGSLTLRFASIQVFAIYSVLALNFYDAFDVGPSCQLEMALLGSSGQVLLAVTFAAIAQQTLSLDLLPEAAGLRLAFIATVAGACANAYASFSGGTVR